MSNQTICFFPIVRYQAELFCNLASMMLSAGIINKVLFICPSVSSFEYVKNKYPCYLTADLLAQIDISNDNLDYNDETGGFNLFELKKFKVEKKYLSENKGKKPENICREARHFIKIWDRFLDDHEVDNLFVWNGYIVPQETMIACAAHRGIKILFFENGYESNAFVMDELGINAKSGFKERLSTAGSIATKVSKVGQTPSVSPKDRLMSYLLLRLKLQWYKFKYHNTSSLRYEFSQPIHSKLIQLFDKILHSESLTPKEPYVFFPLQVIGDSQLIENSIHDQAEVVKKIASLISQVNTERVQPIQFVIKEHPRQNTRRYLKELKQQIKSSNVIFTRFANTNQLIKNAAAVITINSSVGYQALKIRKNVFVLGDSIYEGSGLGVKITEINELKIKLLQIVDKGIIFTDTNEVDEFVDQYQSICYPFNFNHQAKQEILSNIISFLDKGESK